MHIYVQLLPTGSAFPVLIKCGLQLLQVGKHGCGANCLHHLVLERQDLFIYNGRFNPETYLSLMEEEAINVLCCTPTEYRLMAKSEKLKNVNLDQLHNAVSAGEPLNSEVIDVFQKQFGINVRDGYGQTE